MKKLLSSILVLTIVLSAMATGMVSVSADEIAEAYFMTNFSDEPTISYNPAFSPYGYISVVDTGDEHGEVLRVNSVNVANFPNRNDTEGYVGMDNAITSGKVLISYDIKPYASDQTAHIRMNSKNHINASAYAYGTFQLAIFNTTQNEGDATMSAMHYPQVADGTAGVAGIGTANVGYWNRVEHIVDLDNKLVTTYLNGTKANHDLNLALKGVTLTGVKGIELDLISASPHGAADGTDKVDLDNVSIVPLTDEGYKAKLVSVDGKNVDIMFTERPATMTDMEITVSEVATGEEISVVNCGKISDGVLRAELAEEFSGGKEYRINIETNGTASFLGNAYTGGALYYYVEDVAETEIYAVRDGLEYAGVKVVLGRDAQNPLDEAAAAAYYEVKDIGGDHGKVMQINNDTAKMSAFGFALPEATTANKVRYSFDIMGLQTGQPIAAAVNTWVISNVSANEAAAQSYATFLNPNSYTSNTNGLSAWNGGGTYKNLGTQAANTWNTITIEYDFANRYMKSYFDGVLKAEGSLHNMALDSGSLKNVMFEIRDDVPDGDAKGTDVSQNFDKTTNTASFYIDNVTFTDISDKAAVKNVRFTGVKGETIMPDSVIDPAVSEINVAFTAAMNDATIAPSLTYGGNNEPVTIGGTYSDGVYSIEIADKALLPNTEYTLTISGAENQDGTAVAPDYTYTFRTGDGKMEVAEFVILKDGAECKVSDLTVGDTVTVKALIVNTTGETHKATLSYGVYNNNVMNDFDFINMDTSADNMVSSETLTCTVESLDGFAMTAFLWEDFVTCRPIIAEVDMAN